MVMTRRGSRLLSSAAIVAVAGALAASWRASTAPVSATSRAMREGSSDKAAPLVSALARGGRKRELGNEIVGVGPVIRSCELDAAPVGEIGDALDVERGAFRFDAEQSRV